MADIVCLMRQTNYTDDEALKELQLYKTLEDAIKEYLWVVKKETPVISVNQAIFKSIREFIDNAD